MPSRAVPRLISTWAYVQGFFQRPPGPGLTCATFPGGPQETPRRRAMSTTSPTRLSYDVFVSDGPAMAGDEHLPDGSPVAWSPLSSTLVFGTQDALLVDPPFTLTQIQSVGDCVERSG